MEPIRIVPTADKYVESLQRCLDVVARERRYLAFIEAPPVDAVRSFVQFLTVGGGVQLLAVDQLNAVVGWCDVVRNAREGFHHSGQLGMGLLPAYRRRGLGRELAWATIGRAWATNIDRIELEVFAQNHGAVDLYRRVGFVVEGTKRQARKLDGACDDILLMALIKEHSVDTNGVSTVPFNER